MIDSIRDAIAITVDRTAIGVDARAHRRDRTAVVDIGNAVFIGIRKIRTAARVDRLPRPGVRAFVDLERNTVAVAVDNKPGTPDRNGHEAQAESGTPVSKSWVPKH
ncbi:hypothetical protein [Abyssibacter sp.]|uniref:hypothetical protein n=1 Tax=Abyssibacter sp. TaxID=2320200 RepID=UPI0025C179A7|nr:hypothetical protein [Abyssibacter sp.]